MGYTSVSAATMEQLLYGEILFICKYISGDEVPRERERESKERRREGRKEGSYPQLFSLVRIPILSDQGIEIISFGNRVEELLPVSPVIPIIAYEE